MSVHAWCRDIPRDEAVRAAEDGREGPLPTLDECIERQKHAAMTAGVKEGFVKADGEWKRLTDDELRQLLVIPKSVSATSAPEQENKGDSMAGRAEISRAGQFAPPQAPQPPKCTERDNFAAAAKCSPAVSESGEWQSGMPTERVTERRPPEPGGGGNVTGLRTERVTLEITHDLDAPLGDWIVGVIDESLGFDESVRVVDEAKLAPAANAGSESNHAAPAASGAAGPEPDYYVYKNERGRIVYTSQKLVGDEWAAWTITPLYAAPVAESATTPQTPPGWLTTEERRLIEIAVKAQRDPYDITGTSQYNARVLRDLLGRSSPPEVVLEDFTPDAVRNLDTKYLAGWDQCMALAKRAIRDAGVTVKEVGR
jgi:hypothetical protein